MKYVEPNCPRCAGPLTACGSYAVRSWAESLLISSQGSVEDAGDHGETITLEKSFIAPWAALRRSVQCSCSIWNWDELIQELRDNLDRYTQVHIANHNAIITHPAEREDVNGMLRMAAKCPRCRSGLRVWSTVQIESPVKALVIDEQKNYETLVMDSPVKIHSWSQLDGRLFECDCREWKWREFLKTIYRKLRKAERRKFKSTTPSVSTARPLEFEA